MGRSKYTANIIELKRLIYGAANGEAETTMHKLMENCTYSLF